MQIHVVLVRTKYSGNIGRTARAMANMGAQRLILIDPQCEVLNEESRKAAAGAQEQLKNHVVYQSWEDFYQSEGEGVRVALSARKGKRRKALSLEEAGRIIESKNTIRSHFYFIFGPEDHGLSSDDLSFCNFCCSLPVYGKFSSYNLSQAVLLCLFLVRSSWSFLKERSGKEKPLKPLSFPDESIKEWLEEIGFDLSARRSSAYLTVRRLLLENIPTPHELMVLEAILHQNIRKLREYKGKLKNL
ncbi:MAG: TrmH family RNA methyltransferase [Bdellovibrio sp.]|nr:MAG: TrmH family RNA methyltransferase [Bdellovibrio sp.]